MIMDKWKIEKKDKKKLEKTARKLDKIFKDLLKVYDKLHMNDMLELRNTLCDAMMDIDKAERLIRNVAEKLLNSQS
jgi:uncharacterized protein with gpF-like domain